MSSRNGTNGTTARLSLCPGQSILRPFGLSRLDAANGVRRLLKPTECPSTANNWWHLWRSIRRTSSSSFQLRAEQAGTRWGCATCNLARLWRLHTEPVRRKIVYCKVDWAVNGRNSLFVRCFSTIMRSRPFHRGPNCAARFGVRYFRQTTNSSPTRRTVSSVVLRQR